MLRFTALVVQRRALLCPSPRTAAFWFIHLFDWTTGRSMGCTLFAMAFGHCPFENERDGVLTLAIQVAATLPCSFLASVKDLPSLHSHSLCAWLCIRFIPEWPGCLSWKEAYARPGVQRGFLRFHSEHVVSRRHGAAHGIGCSGAGAGTASSCTTGREWGQVLRTGKWGPHDRERGAQRRWSDIAPSNRYHCSCRTAGFT
jgi:hypothetical protein